MSDNDLIRRGDALYAIAGWEAPSTAIAALPAVIVQEAQVNETPKSEHDASDMLSPEVQRMIWDGWRNDPESNAAWCAGNDYALTRLCKVLGVDPEKVSWDGSDGSLDEEADALIWRIIHANDDDDGKSPAIRDAEARGMERAANMVARAPLSYLPHSPGAVVFFADPTATLNNIADAIRAEAAAHRKDGEPK